MILDIIIIVLVLAGAFFGYKKGLVGIAISLISIILSIVLGVMFSGLVAEGLYNDTSIGKNIEQSISQSILTSNNSEEVKSDNIYDSIVANIVGNAKEAISTEQTAKIVTMYILKGISFIGIFIAVFIICYILRMVLNLVFDLPILNSVNKFGGIAAGLLKVIVKIYIVLAIISFLSPVPLLQPIINYINSSTIAKLLYNNNLFVYIINSGIKI